MGSTVTKEKQEELKSPLIEKTQEESDTTPDDYVFYQLDLLFSSF
jgi:hypothetical protein